MQVSTPADNFVLDHALLYCIGVNLPNHHFGQLDRVLVVASPINDVNLHAWNLSRVKRFLIVEAGIQMELCGDCMGHRKKTVTFLISPNFVQDCTEFLVKEARMSSEPKQMSSDGPIYYSLPHNCSMVAESGDGTALFPTYTNAERIVLGNKSTGTGFYVNHDVRVRSYSTSTTASSHKPPPPPVAHPSLPPRTVLRMHNESSVTQSFLSGPKETGRQVDTVPYQINHRIYVNQSGAMTEDSHIFGSGSCEHSGRRNQFPRTPVVPPRREPTRFDSPMYIHENDIHSPMGASCSQSFQRPEFIGKNPPCLPPRDMGDNSPVIRRSKSDNTVLIDASPASLRRNSEFPHSRTTTIESPSPELTTPPTYDESVSYQNVSRSHRPNIINTGTDQRSPSPQSCTDDITNAEFALITKLTFSGQVLPPRSQPRTPRRPMPVPRSKIRQTSPEMTFVQCSSTLEADISISTEAQQQEGKCQKDKSYGLNPMYSTLVGNERETSSSSSSSTQASPALQRKAFQMRNISFSSSSLTSEDYNKLIRKHTPLIKQYPHEV